MNLELMSITLIGGLFLLLFAGVEIAVAMGVMAVIGLMFFIGRPTSEFAFTAWNMMNSFVFTAMPLFVFMGAILYNTGVIRALFTSSQKVLGSLPGGVACAVIAANAVFGAMCGVSAAAAATFGKIAFPEMERLGYQPKLALGSIAIAGTLSVLIPPSVIIIVFGGWFELSVARLFAAALVPGLILTFLLMLTVIVRVVLNPSLAPKTPSISLKERIVALGDVWPFLGVVVLVLGVIFAGIMTPTESAALGAFLSVALALGFKKMTFNALKDSMWTAVKINAMIAFVLVTARVLGQVFQYTGVTQEFEVAILSLPFGKYGIFAVICLMYLFLGCFFDTLSMLLITMPFVAPVIKSLGFDMIWFGIVYVVLADIAIVTPPFGLNLFVLNSVVPKYDIVTIALGALPFLIPALLTIVILTAFPQLVLWLPSVLY